MYNRLSTLLRLCIRDFPNVEASFIQESDLTRVLTPTKGNLLG
jgi:hypothetical protein